MVRVELLVSASWGAAVLSLVTCREHFSFLFAVCAVGKAWALLAGMPCRGHWFFSLYLTLLVSPSS